MICLADRKKCVGYKDGKCITIENCMHQGDEYRYYTLNLDKVNSIDDCKKILNFLCKLTIKPLPCDVEYGGFSEVEEYFSK